MKRQAGYSGTPLAKKLGVPEGAILCLLDAPRTYRELLSPLPAAVRFASQPDKQTDVVHLFVTARSDLARQLRRLLTVLRPDAALWVSWPKKASRVSTDVTEDVIREEALPLGLVDVKVCAVDETWSGLKLVVRKAKRK
jgi:hypothetical protein